MTTFISWEKFGIDIVDIELSGCRREFDILEDHLTLVENEITRLTDEAKQRQKSKLADLRLENYDSDDWRAHSQKINHEYWRIEEDLQRLFRGAHLVMLYAAYESAISEIARYVKDKEKHELSLDDFKGGFLDRAKKYYKHVLKIDIHTQDKTWKSIQMLCDIRNAFGHANGRIDAVTKESKGKIKKHAKEVKGIDLTSGYIVVSAELLRTFTNEVSELVENIINQLKHNRKNPLKGK